MVSALHSSVTGFLAVTLSSICGAFYFMSGLRSSGLVEINFNCSSALNLPANSHMRLRLLRYVLSLNLESGSLISSYRPTTEMQLMVVHGDRGEAGSHFMKMHRRRSSLACEYHLQREALGKAI